MEMQINSKLEKAVLPDPRCVVRVGDGRGFIVKQRRRVHGRKIRGLRLRKFLDRMLVITAAHCLPKLPPAHIASYLEERTYANLVGDLNGEARLWAECLFVDPICDVAVLDGPDGQELFDQSAAFETFIEDRPFLRVAEPRSGPGWMLSLDNKWVPITLKVNRFVHGRNLEVDKTCAGQSGSPILRRDGRAVGMIAIGGGLGARDAGQPIFLRDLPMWWKGERQ